MEKGSEFILQFIKLKEKYGNEYAIIDLIDKRIIRDSFRNIDDIDVYREWFKSKIPIDNINKDQYISKFLYYTQNNEKSLEKIAYFINEHGSDAIPLLFQLGSFLKNNLDESLKIIKHILRGGLGEKRSLESLMLEAEGLKKRMFRLSDDERILLDNLKKTIKKIKKGKESKIDKLDELIKKLDLRVKGAKDDIFEYFKDIFFENDNPKQKKFGDGKKEEREIIDKFDIKNTRYNQIKLKFEDLGILGDTFSKIFEITGGHKKRLNKFLYFISKCNDIDSFLAILDPLNKLNVLYKYNFDNNINNLRRKLLVVLKLQNGKKILSKIIKEKESIRSIQELSRLIEKLNSA